MSLDGLCCCTRRSSPQFLDPLLLTLEVFRETRRRVAFLTAAKSMKRKAVGFFARQMDSSKYLVPSRLLVDSVFAKYL